jgi:hypothetical protein
MMRQSEARRFQWLQLCGAFWWHDRTQLYLTMRVTCGCCSLDKASQMMPAAAAVGDSSHPNSSGAAAIQVRKHIADVRCSKSCL